MLIIRVKIHPKMNSYEDDNVLRQCEKINYKQLHAAVLLEKVTVP